MGFAFFALNQLNEKMRLAELLESKNIRNKVMLGIVIGTILYIIAIIMCQCLAKSLLPSSDWEKTSAIWYWVTGGRIAIVLFFGLLTSFAVLYQPNERS